MDINIKVNEGLQNKETRTITKIIEKCDECPYFTSTIRTAYTATHGQCEKIGGQGKIEDLFENCPYKTKKPETAADNNEYLLNMAMDRMNRQQKHPQYCHRCGTHIQAKQKYCHECGEELNAHEEKHANNNSELSIRELTPAELLIGYLVYSLTMIIIGIIIGTSI